MRFFGIGPVPILRRCAPPVPGGPGMPMLKEWDAFYTDTPVIGVDFVSDCSIEYPCSFTAVQFMCDFGAVGLEFSTSEEDVACSMTAEEFILDFGAVGITTPAEICEIGVVGLDIEDC